MSATATSSNQAANKEDQLIAAVTEGRWVKEEKKTDWYGRSITVHLVPQSFIEKHKLERYLPKDLPKPDSERGCWWKGAMGTAKLVAGHNKDLCSWFMSDIDYNKLQMEMTPLTTSFSTSTSFWLGKDPRTNLAMIKEHRNTPGGIFEIYDNESSLLPALKHIFGSDVTNQDCILQCGPERSAVYRELLAKHFSKGVIDSHRKMLTDFIDQRIDSWAAEGAQGKPVDLLSECQLLAGEALNRVIFGTGLKNPRELVEASTMALDYIIRSVMAGGVEPNNEEDAALTLLRQATEEAFAAKDSPLLMDMAKEERMTELQRKIMVLVIIMAGKDNVAQLINHVLLQLLHRPELREQLTSALESNDKTVKRTVMRNLHVESLRMASGPYAIGRRIHQRIYVIAKDSQSQDKLIQAIDPIVRSNFDICPHAVGRNPHLFQSPNLFDPNRTNINTVMSKVKPFGGSHHRCPAEHWSLLLAQLFQERLWTQCTVEPIPCEAPRLHGGTTLTLRGKMPALVTKKVLN